MILIYIILSLILLGLFWANLALSIQYVYSIYINLRLKRWSKIPLSLFLKSFIWEYIFYNIRLVLSTSRHLPKSNNHSSKKIIIFIHGYLGHSSDWTYFISKLNKNSTYLCYALNHTSFKSVPELAQKTTKEIEGLKLQPKDIILIGHSMGGLIASYIAENSDLPIKKVYSLGAPLLGTPIARYGMGSSCKDMIPLSPFLNGLKDQILNSHPKKYFFLWSILDNTVFPAPIDHTFDKQQVTFIKCLGHTNILFSNKVFNTIFNDLNTLYLDK